MTVATGDELMAKKKSKSETRKHTALARMDADALEQAKLAASLMRMSVADYLSDLVRRYAGKDITREAKKLTGEKDE